MSYCRFSEADVYVYASSGGGLDCCFCSLQEREFETKPDSLLGFLLKPVGEIIKTHGLTTDEMVDHLRIHIDRGDHVPDHVIPDILADREENDGK